jgi:hypothetical protein
MRIFCIFLWLKYVAHGPTAVQPTATLICKDFRARIFGERLADYYFV